MTDLTTSGAVVALTLDAGQIEFHECLFGGCPAPYIQRTGKCELAVRLATERSSVMPDLNRVALLAPSSRTACA